MPEAESGRVWYNPWNWEAERTVAQRLERHPYKLRVGGSTPPSPTKRVKGKRKGKRGAYVRRDNVSGQKADLP